MGGWQQTMIQMEFLKLEKVIKNNPWIIELLLSLTIFHVKKLFNKNINKKLYN